MDDLRIFIKAWDDTGDIAKVLEQGLSLPETDKIQSFLASLPAAEQDRIKASLTTAMVALEAYAHDLERETALIKDQINQTVQSAKACLSYNSADQIKRK